MDANTSIYPVPQNNGFYPPIPASCGLTIRAEFAKAAMKGMHSSHRLMDDVKRVAQCAVAQADALIAELNKKESV
jgi:hypothetical protein